VALPKLYKRFIFERDIITAMPALPKEQEGMRL
jgi:hypothetical protein